MRIHSPQITGSAANTNIVLTTVTSSISVLSASFAATSSYANNFTVGGTLTAQTIVAQTITSSIEFITGSTRNGSLLTNTHQFTGSVGITGSLAINGTGVIVGSGTTNELAYWVSTNSVGALTVTTYPSLTELSYVKGVTSAIQTQLNAKQATITLTTTGTSGAATFSSNTLNIPNYGSALSGYLPLTGGTLTGALGGTSATFSSSVTAPNFVSLTGFSYPTINVWTTFYTMASERGIYSVIIGLGDQSFAEWQAYGTIFCQSSTGAFSTIYNSSLVQIRTSGLNIQVLLATGAAFTRELTFKVLRS